MARGWLLAGWPAALAALMALVALPGCVSRTTSPAFWQLEPVAPMPAEWDAGASGVLVSAVGIPRYLDRPEILQNTGPGRLVPAPYDRWAEPLDDGIVRVLGEELARRLASENVAAYPAEPRFPVEFQVVVDVERFDGRMGEAVKLVARWSLLAGIGGPALVTRREDIEVPAGGSMSAFVAAHAEALGELARRIAQGVETTPRPRADSGEPP